MWTKEKVFEEVSKLTTIKEFQSNKALVSAASRLGIYKECSNKLISIRNKYPEDMSLSDIKHIAMQFNTREEFKKAHSSLYKRFTKEQLAELYGSPGSIKIKYLKEDLINEAKKYSTRNALKIENPNLYNTIRKRKLTEEAFYHMESPKCVKYTFEELQTEALKYTTKQTFKLSNYGMYQAACKHKDFESMCSHMIPGKIATNYHKPMWLYIVKITTLNNSLPIAYKVGITKRSYILDRFWTDYVKKDTVIEVLFKIKYNTGREAHTKEQEIINQYKDYKYTEESPLLRTRTSEMFTIDVSKGICLRDCDSAGEPLI